MTLIIGIVCDDGVVLAADSASSDPEAGTKQPFEKIRRLGELPILCGGSGDVGLLQKINEGLSSITEKPSLKRFRQEVKKIVIPELRDAYENHVPYPQQGFHQPPCAILLLAGVSNREPWLPEIEKDGRDTMYGEEPGNFVAIVSGKPWAQVIFRLHLKTKRDLKLGKILAYRDLEDSLNLAASFLAKPIHTTSSRFSAKMAAWDWWRFGC